MFLKSKFMGFSFVRMMLRHIPTKMIPYILRPIDASKVRTKVKETFAIECTCKNLTFSPKILTSNVSSCFY